MSESSSEPDRSPDRTGDPPEMSPAAPRGYTRRELARHDGSDPALPVLIAHGGRVYDVTRSYPWARGTHWGDHRAGRDLTGQFDPAIHGVEMLDRIPYIGVLCA